MNALDYMVGSVLFVKTAEGGDTVPRKKSIQELREEEAKAKRELKIAKQDLKIIESEEKRLRKNKRTHRLCNHGGLLEIYLPPEEYTEEQIQSIMKTIFRWQQTKELLEKAKNDRVLL